MKRKLWTALFTLLVCLGINAQPPQGEPGGGRRPGGPPPNGMAGRPTNSGNQFVLEAFPEIPNLSLEQREKVGTLLTKENKAIMKQMDKRRKIEEQIVERPTEKQQQKLHKIDLKIQSIKEKTNKKVAKVLSAEQFQVFLKKRTEFRFRPQGGQPPRGDGQRPERPSGGNGPM